MRLRKDAHTADHTELTRAGYSELKLARAALTELTRAGYIYIIELKLIS
jgi:hypothetical protein